MLAAPNNLASNPGRKWVKWVSATNHNFPSSPSTSKTRVRMVVAPFRDKRAQASAGEIRSCTRLCCSRILSLSLLCLHRKFCAHLISPHYSRSRL
ncbi:uncharacterized protein M421DRAFT_202294 [Didymella exigua CBS 183.55]|uniref:Uncharacterized protein n=1 Tax=Didymella exigua CBS 183.55 TaxID=1150837 RepID=A0A6A5S239_9PLEO|nr:uncharacterized protein M421DRAFT_202294 [Didymella exigua CBS 183.55]KAF1933670.1 hypothetical protein M421DRAFT_202294 [Didymella exigua CBS 183.55]